VALLDVGVAADVPDHPMIRRARIRSGTDDLAEGPAMARDDAVRAVLAGADLAGELLSDGADLLVTGDMGIANTTATSCLIGALTGASAEEVTGRGAGIDDATLSRKREVVAGALDRVAALADPDGAFPAHVCSKAAIVAGVLAQVGGLEHAALAGVILAGAAARVPVVLDGVTTDAAALVAVALHASVGGYLIAGHRSVEPGATVALRHLGLEPLLDLSLRLGEGTGGLLAVPLVRAAAAVLGGMARLSDVDVG
jgi:nicotinate-nucleotide--dimethylbenzimidazole phosphoribosyltransferase